MQAQYFPPSHIPNNVHILPPMSREDNPQRKRPKYTRSKTGCLTCRAKKIKVSFMTHPGVKSIRINCKSSSAMSQSPLAFAVHTAREMYVGTTKFGGTLLMSCQCTWPETVPVVRDSTSQMPTADNFDCLPLTAECSGISDASSPPTRSHTPPIRHHHLPMNLPAQALRRQR